MKRKGCWMLLVIGGLLFGCSPVVSAEDSMEELTAASGADTLFQSVDASVSSALERFGVSIRDPSSFLDLQFLDILSAFFQDAVEKAEAPFQLFGILLILILFTAVLQSVGGTGLQKQTGSIYEMVCVLAAALVLGQPLSACFLSVKDTLQQGASFMMTFVPVFAGILAAGGHTGTAVCYQAAVCGLANCIMQFLAGILLPLLSMTFAMSIVDGVNPSVSLGGFIRAVKRVTIWLLGLCMAIFLGVVSMQSFVGGAADSAATKAAKYVVSNFVPVIGGAVSDAYSTVRGSLGILKSATGAIGMIVLCLLFLPVFLHVFLYRLVVTLAAATAELFSVPQLARLLRNTEQVLSITFAVVTCFAIMFLVATAIVIGLSSGQI